MPPRQSFGWRFHMEPEAGGRVYSASVGSLATMCLLARNQRLFIDQKVSVNIRVPPWGWEQTKFPELCLQAKWHLLYINDSFSCYTYIYIWVDAPFYRRCLFSFLRFHVCLFRAQRFGYVLFSKHNHARKFGSRWTDAETGPLVQLRLSLPLLHRLDFRQVRHLPSAARGRLFCFFFFFVLLHRLSDSAKHRDRKE